MTESNETDVLIGDRGLMAYTDRARTTVRDWHQRPQGALPYTTNDKGHKVFKVTEVDQWLVSRPAAQTGGPDTKHLRRQFIETKERVRELERELSELKTAKTANPDKLGQLLDAQENVRTLARECLQKMPDRDPSKADAFVVDFFNKVQTYLQLEHAPNQNTTEASH